MSIRHSVNKPSKKRYTIKKSKSDTNSVNYLTSIISEQCRYAIFSGLANRTEGIYKTFRPASVPVHLTTEPGFTWQRWDSMLKKSIDSRFLTRTGFMEFFIAGVKLTHAISATLPGILLLLSLESAEDDAWHAAVGLLLFFAILTVIMFQALGVYSEEFFSNRLRFRVMLIAWTSAFCILLVMYLGLHLLPIFSLSDLFLWYGVSLVLFGLERLLLLRLFHAWMATGKYLQRTVILGFSESAQYLVEHMQHHGDIRSGLIGFIDDRSERTPKAFGGLPLLGNTRDLEKLIRTEQVNQVLIALPWVAHARIGGLVERLRQMSVNVALVPDITTLRYGHNRVTDVGGILMFNTSELPLRGWSPLIKRCEDIGPCSVSSCCPPYCC